MKNNLLPISRLKCLSTLLFMLFSISVFALKGDEKQPIKVDADHATADMKQMITVFTGNVIITQGSLIVHADKATASQDKDGYKTIILYGNPVRFEQTTDDGGKIEGQGNQFNYNTKSNLAILTGRARVQKDKNIIIGNTITYNTQTQIYSAASLPADGVSKKSSGRITVILDQINK